jgi:hypothetical protein
VNDILFNLKLNKAGVPMRKLLPNNKNAKINTFCISGRRFCVIQSE